MLVSNEQKPCPCKVRITDLSGVSLTAKFSIGNKIKALYDRLPEGTSCQIYIVSPLI